MFNKVKVGLLFFYILFLSFPAHAYLDPGTGSIILQGLIGGIAAAGAISTIYFQKIKSFFKRNFTRPETPEVSERNE